MADDRVLLKSTKPTTKHNKGYNKFNTSGILRYVAKSTLQ